MRAYISEYLKESSSGLARTRESSWSWEDRRCIPALPMVRRQTRIKRDDDALDDLIAEAVKK